MILLQSSITNKNITEIILDFIINCQFKYVSFNDIHKFLQLNKLESKIKYDFGSNFYQKLTQMLDDLVEQNKIKKEVFRMVTHYYVK